MRSLLAVILGFLSVRRDDCGHRCLSCSLRTADCCYGTYALSSSSPHQLPVSSSCDRVADVNHAEAVISVEGEESAVLASSVRVEMETLAAAQVTVYGHSERRQCH